MAEKDSRIIIFLILLSFASVLPYLQFVVPGTTQADSSPIHTSNGTYNYWPDRTVDGNTSQKIKACLHTAVNSTITLAWLRIDLNGVKSIKYVKFWYRNDRGSDSQSIVRLRGYSVRVSNTTDTPTNSSQACYTDPGTTTLSTINQNDCNRTARYIWFYQRHKTDAVSPILEICEVEVLDCNTGYYGENCSHDCSHCMNKDRCNIDTGACDELGCALGGYQPPLCQECRPEIHGYDCSLDCSEFCINGRCNSSNGVCIQGCKPGYQGPYCNQTCPFSYYGNDCKESCGHCFENVTCNHVNGTCSEGCGKGFKGKRCNTPCDSGEYGFECKYNCSGNCYGGVNCDKYEGYCDMCADGYQGPTCDEKCNKGTYGGNCSSECGNCLNAEACHHINGSCPRGCQPGWQDTDTCDAPCSNGMFGMACVFNCSGNCANNEICDKRDGKCQQCSGGWENLYCNKTCDGGRYGPGCRYKCGQCYGAQNCSGTNGSCPSGCITGYSGDTCSESMERSSTSPDVAAIAAPVIGVIFLVAVIVAVITLRRRQTREKDEHVQMQDIQKQVDEEVEIAEVQQPPAENVYYNTSQICSKNIKIGELRTVIQSLEDEDGENNFEKEFRGIPYGEQAGIPCTFGKLSHNIPKNRFKTTFPYDHSRVVLSSTQNGDYINANFIKDASGETAYIASQGPKLNTVRDFWQMIWQENVFVIAMVTNTAEGATIKCERYWPESVGSKVTKENFSIYLTSEKNYATFSIHKLRVINNEMKNSRSITHLQFTAWPDHGTPNPLELLVFYRYVVRAREKHPENTLVVHCSAGIGRTGTFIALDALYKQGTREGTINVAEYVHTMREDRMNMVQNAYKFLYYVLHEAFRSQGHLLNKMDFVKEIESEISSTRAVNLSKFMKEFTELASVKPVFEEKDTKFGKQNIQLNMTKTMLPADKMRIILTSHIPGRGTYYNAVPISTFTMKDSIIAAQYPVPGAAVDLIRLLVDHECSTLLSTDLLSDIPSSAEWFSPLNGRQEIMNYQVEFDSTTQPTKHILKSNMSVKAPSENDWHRISVYEFATWKSTEVLPSDPSAILDSIKCIQQNEIVDMEHKLCVLSRDGATGCGVFCAVYNAIQQLQQDEEVDMFTIVRQLQSRRPEMISDMNEYMLCYQTVLQYLTSKIEPEEVYVNPRPDHDDSIYANVEQ